MFNLMKQNKQGSKAYGNIGVKKLFQPIPISCWTKKNKEIYPKNENNPIVPN